MMAQDRYTKALKKIMTETTAPPTTRSRAEIEAEILQISEALRGPLKNFERLELIEVRQCLRIQLDAAR
jgi:hypothetical protein